MKAAKILTCIGLMLGMCLSMLLQTQLATAMPAISREFGTTAYYSWVYSGYLLASTVTLPLFGSFCDRFGYRRNYLIGGIVFLLGTLLSGLSPGMTGLILSRVLAGLGAGMLVPAAYGMIGTLFQKEQMRRVYGFAAVFQIINTGLGSLLGGFFATHFTWRLGLFLLLPPGLAGLLLVVLSSRENLRAKNTAPLRLGSALILIPALLITLLGLEKMSRSLSVFGLSLLFAGGALLAAFIIYERRSQAGLLPPEFMKNSRLRGLLYQVMLMGGILNSCMAYLPVYMTGRFSWTTETSGKALLIYIAAMGTASLLSSLLKKEAGRIISMGWISLLLGCGAGAVSYFTGKVGVFFCSLLLLGTGVGILTGTLLGVIQAQIESRQAGINSIAHLMRNLGGALGVSIMSLMLTGAGVILFAGVFVSSALALILHGSMVLKERKD